MKKNKKEIVGFEFQEIPLEEARNVVLAGDGNYSEVKERILTMLPEIEARNARGGEQKAFAFGLGRGEEIQEDQRRGLCVAVNKALKKGKIDWHVTYSGSRKLFICVPEARKEAVQARHYVPRSRGSDVSEMDAELLRLRDQEGLSTAEIIAMNKYPRWHVKYLLEQKIPKFRPNSEEGSRRDKALALLKQGMTVRQVAAKLGFKMPSGYLYRLKRELKEKKNG